MKLLRLAIRRRLQVGMVALVALAGLGLVLAAAVAPPARAQTTPPTATGVEATLFTGNLRWTTSPAVFVTAELRDAAGTVRGNATGLSNDQGVVDLAFGRGGGPGPAPGPGGGATIQAGYEIRLTPAGGQTVAVKVPDLAVGVNVAANQIVGHAPAGAVLALQVWLAGAQSTADVTSDAAGHFAYPVPAPGAIAPGDYGSVVLTTAEGNKFGALFHVLEAEVTIGARQVSGHATLGTTVSASLTGAGGRSKGSGSAAISNTDAFQIAGGRGTQVGAVAAGDTVSVTQTSIVPGATFTVRGVVPDLAVSINLARAQVEGQAPAGGQVAIELVSPYGDTYERTAATDAAGHFAADVSDVPEFGRGWTASVICTVVPGLRVRAVHTLEQVRVGVHRSLVEGVGQPGQLITVTVRAADGRVKGAQPIRIGGQGQFQTYFSGNATIAIGDVVEVEFLAGDPVSVLVSQVSAVTDAEADTVSGVAPSGTSVRVSQGTGVNQKVVRTDADSSGRYTASFAGIADIVAPMSGDVVVRLASGHELFTGWAAVQMTVEIGQPFVAGNGPVGRAANLELVDPSGTVVASGVAYAAGGGGPGIGPSGPAGSQWAITLQDTLGANVAVRSGDTIRAQVGDDFIEVVVPELSGAAFVSDDLVNGHTTPNRDLTMRITHAASSGNASADVTSDENGNFSYDFSGTFDIQHNDTVLFTTREKGHIINSRVLVPGLRLDLDTATLVGSWRPDAKMLVELDGPSGTRASAEVTCGPDAVFTVDFVDRAGQRTLPQPGDTVVVEPDGQLVDEPLTMTVPELTIAWDVATDAMGGRATPGGSLAFTVRDVIDRGLTGPMARRADPTIAADGSYAVSFRPPVDLLPGMEMVAQYRLPSGHIAVRTRTTALLNVQYGGANVCGFAEPLEHVTVTAADTQGAEVARGSTEAGYRSAYSLQLSTPAGQAFATGQGNYVSAVLAGDLVSMTLPALDIQVDWTTGRVQGTGPARSSFQVLRPARGCLDTGARFVQRGRTGNDGSFTVPMPGLDPGEGFELAFFTADGHRFYRHVFRSLGQIYVYTDKVKGRATPQSQVAITLFSADGTWKGAAETMADANGRFSTVLRAADGSPVTSIPGDRVHLEASGESPDITVEELQFDWSPGEAIVGTAPPNRTVAVTVSLTGDQTASFALSVGADGTFRFGAGDVPPRSAWGLADVTGVTAVLETPNGHQIVSETGEAPPPVSRPYWIYLPRASNNN